jgi:hypothetical protein
MVDFIPAPASSRAVLSGTWPFVSVLQFEFFGSEESPPGGTAVHSGVSHCSMRPAVNTRHFSRCRVLSLLRYTAYCLAWVEPFEMVRGLPCAPGRAMWPLNPSCNPSCSQAIFEPQRAKSIVSLRVVGHGVFHYLRTWWRWARRAGCKYEDMRMIHTHIHASRSRIRTSHRHTKNKAYCIVQSLFAHGRSGPP